MTKHITTTGSPKPTKPRARGRMSTQKVVLESGQIFTVSRKTADFKAKKVPRISHVVVTRERTEEHRTWSLVSLLGLGEAVGEFSNTIHGYLTISGLIREGLPLSVMDNLKDAGVDAGYRNMIIPPRTLQHRATKGEPLSPTESERAYRVANIMSLADQVFGNREKGLRWLHKPSRALEGKSPLDVLDNELGARMVEDLLGRLDEGYFA